MLADRALELVGSRLRVAQWQRGEGAEPLRIRRDDLLGDPVVELASERHTLGAGQGLGARRHGGQYLDGDARLVHVGDPPGAKIEKLGPAAAAREELLVPAGLAPPELGRREVLLQCDEEQLPVPVRCVRQGTAERPHRRRRGNAEACGAAQELTPAQGAAGHRPSVIGVPVDHDVVVWTPPGTQGSISV